MTPYSLVNIMFAVTINTEEHSSTLNLKTACSSQMLASVYQTRRTHISENHNPKNTNSRWPLNDTRQCKASFTPTLLPFHVIFSSLPCA
jgi:hypothetical protein